MDFDGLKAAVVRLLAGESCKVNTVTFANDMTTLKSKNDILTLLVHLGYLSYDKSNEAVFIPNEEIRREFVNAMDGSEWSEVIEAVSSSEKLLKETIAGNAHIVADRKSK